MHALAQRIVDYWVPPQCLNISSYKNLKGSSLAIEEAKPLLLFNFSHNWLFLRLSQAALRRPTGLPAIVPQESLDNHGSYTDPDPEKSVGFDDNVEKIGNSAEDGEKLANSGNSLSTFRQCLVCRLRSVADRRPTKFVFGQPLESGVLDPIADIPEERRRSLDLPDDKKKVAFDVENVERMDFEPVEEQDEEEEMGDTPENNVFKAEVELNIKADETQLPSQVLKEIF